MGYRKCVCAGGVRKGLRGADSGGAGNHMLSTLFYLFVLFFSAGIRSHTWMDTHTPHNRFAAVMRER